MYLFILPNLKMGGAERVIQTLIFHLKSNGMDYELFVLHRNGNENNWKDLNPIVLSNFRFLGYFYFLRLKKPIYDYSISTHYFINYFLGLFRYFNLIKVKKMCFRESTPFFYRNNGLVKIILTILHSIFYPNADKIIFQSKFMSDNFFQNVFTCNHVQTLILKNPILFQKIDYLKNHESIDIPKDINEAWISMGRLIPEKGFDILIRSYVKFYNNFPKLYIFGNGPELIKLNSLIDKLKVREFIQILNHCDNPYPVIYRASGCIVSSRVEGFPNILNEMVYLNNNVLSTICVPDIASINFIIRCLPNDSDSLGNALCELNLRNNKIRNLFSSERNCYLEQLEVSNYLHDLNN
jgi:glycosyltransferase involved in cell wall biosynthesis